MTGHMFNRISFCQYLYVLNKSESSVDMMHGKRRRPAMYGDSTRKKENPNLVVRAWVWSILSWATLAYGQGVLPGAVGDGNSTTLIRNHSAVVFKQYVWNVVGSKCEVSGS